MIYCFTFFENQGINEFNKNSTYVKNNEVTEIFDNKQSLSVKLEYDKNGREVLRKFGNGTAETTLYDKAGRVTVKAQKSERNELLWAEGYVYGTDGKRTATVDNKGRVTLYEYNNKGQLETVYYPYTQEMINLLKKEAEENGLPTNTDISENKYLPADIKSGLSSLLNSMQYGLAYSLPNMQIFAKESYSYDKNGNRTGKTTKYGTINYSYDKENRLVSSGSRGQAFINYTYDNAGNLLTEESANKTTKYAYNALNRLIYCEVLDKAEKTYAQTTYAYDAFGRRVIVQDKGEAAVRTLYDGFTFDVIKQSSTLANGLFTDSNNIGIRWSPTGKPTGDRYRYISDEEAQDDNRYFYLDENTYKTVNSRYRGERTQISVNGLLAAQASLEGEQYFTTDLLGSVASVTDAYGSSQTSYTYDVFGSLVQGKFSGSTDFGYLGKQNDQSSKLYNYGYRDYKPEAARFTTIDPIRDGTNWFTYVNNDPVNHIDLWGLCEGSDKSATLKKQKEIEDEFGYGNYLCYITTGLNIYISEKLVQESFIEKKFSEIIKTNLNEVGEIIDFNVYSMKLGKELNQKDYYAFVYDPDKKGEQVTYKNKQDFYDSKYKYGVGRYYEKGSKWKGKPDHFELFRNKPYNDIINPGVAEDEGEYELYDIWPVQPCPIPGVPR